MSENLEAKQSSKPNETVGMVLVMLPVVAAILTWTWIGNMRMIDGPMSKLGLLTALTVLGTAMLISYEANVLGFGTDPTRSRHEQISPMSWFFFVILLWIYEYPLYLYLRSKYGAKNLLGFGLISAIVWIISLSVIVSEIRHAEDVIRGVH